MLIGIVSLPDGDLESQTIIKNCNKLKNVLHAAPDEPWEKTLKRLDLYLRLKTLEGKSRKSYSQDQWLKDAQKMLSLSPVIQASDEKYAPFKELVDLGNVDSYTRKATIKEIQKKVGVTADGLLGNKTLEAIREFLIKEEKTLEKNENTKAKEVSEKKKNKKNPEEIKDKKNMLAGKVYLRGNIAETTPTS